jgi:hypothetical protein
MPANPNTNTWRPVQNNLTSTSTSDCLSAYQGNVLNGKFANYVPILSTGSTTIKATNGVALETHANGTRGYQLYLQNDGNLVLYNKSGSAIWQTATSNR